MNGEPGAFSRGLSRVRAGFNAFIGRPTVVQAAGVASVLLILGALLPWIDYGGVGESQYVLGVEAVTGGLTVIAGAAALVVLSRQLAGGLPWESGHLAALGLLASLVVAADLIHSADGEAASPGFGIWVSAGAAVVLLLSGIALYGGAVRTDRPAD